MQAQLARPRLGYCGVIDERINLDLIASVAQARPDWEIVMVGPIAKVDPGALPRRQNIHWLGRQSYDDLPSFITGWDVCLMPFALNEATRYISPTKTLEYMACGRPSVSTSIRDVVEPYGHLVQIADTPQGYVASCAEILERSRPEQHAHAQALAQVVARKSWDSTASAMRQLIAQADAALEGDSILVQAQAVANDSGPFDLAGAAQGVSMVGPAAQANRATAAG